MISRALFASRTPPRWLTSLALLMVCSLGAAFAHAGDDVATPLERRVKAAFLYRFVDYVQWPEVAAAAQSPFVIAILEEDRLADELVEIVNGRTVNGRKIIVRRLKNSDSYADANVLFVGRDENVRLAHIARTTQQKPVLVVCEGATGLDNGCAINFVLNEDRVRFEISLAAAEKNGLVLSSHLLAVALSVRPKAL